MIASATAVKPSLTQAMHDDPSAIVEQVAKDYDVSPREVVTAMPEAMRRFAPGDAFVPALKDIARWGDVTVIVHTDDGIMEFTGPVPDGEIARDYYNLMGRTGFHGHLRYKRCDGAAFVERPFMGRPSASLLFFNAEGGIMLKVFVGRDEKRDLKADQLAAFRALADRLCGAG
jgi:putative heme utilization carrier protein HutX